MKQFKTSIGLMTMSLMLFSFSNCGNAKMSDSQPPLVENPPFVLGEVFYQDWVAGTKEGGSGTRVHITVASFTENVQVSDIYFKDKKAKAQNSPHYPRQYVGNFMNATNRDVIMDSNPTLEAQNTPPAKSPFALNENDAVLSYVQNGTLKYYKISNMKQKPILAYPQSNPNDDN